MKAFTLLELLVVIFIIGIFITLCFTIFTSSSVADRDEVSGSIERKEFRVGAKNNYYYIWVQGKKIRVTPIEFDRLNKGDRWPE